MDLLSIHFLDKLPENNPHCCFTSASGTEIMGIEGRIRGMKKDNIKNNIVAFFMIIGVLVFVATATFATRLINRAADWAFGWLFH